MKALSWIIPLLAGFIGIGVGITFFSPAQTTDSHSNISQLVDSWDKQNKKNAELSKTVEELKERLAELEAHASAMGVPTSKPTALDAPAGEIPSTASTARSAQRTSTSAAEAGNGEPTPGFRAWVKQVVADQKAEEVAKEKALADQRRIDRVNRRVDQAAGELQLNNFQKDEVKKILIEEEQARTQLMSSFASMDGTPDRENAWQSMNDLRKSRDEKLKAILSPDQMEKSGSLLGFGGGRGPGAFMQGRNRGNGAQTEETPLAPVKPN